MVLCEVVELGRGERLKRRRVHLYNKSLKALACCPSLYGSYLYYAAIYRCQSRLYRVGWEAVYKNICRW